MTKLLKFSLSLLLVSCATAKTPELPSQPAPYQKYSDPSEIYGELFERVEVAPVFTDSKVFCDMIPKLEPARILADEQLSHPGTKEQLTSFVSEHFFNPPAPNAAEFKPAPHETLRSHIHALWSFLRRGPDAPVPGSSLIGLPKPYIVPGGRFREIYYWDSYFTELGLLADNQEDDFKSMVEDFDFLIKTFGRIPNGNRSYYRSRSHPPVFSLMVALWRDRFGAASTAQFRPSLKAEYEFWTHSPNREAKFPEGSLSHYSDDEASPRPEAYKEDVALASRAEVLYHSQTSFVYRNLRAGAESGWDFSSRWMRDKNEFASIDTTAFAPIDLNAFLYQLEMELAQLADDAHDKQDAGDYRKLAEKRRDLIFKYMWDEKSGTFRDYDMSTKSIAPEETVAQVVPLFVGLATPAQAKRVAHSLERKFLKPGGLVTTTRVSRQQWDAPNGWAPHQWMAYAGLMRYGQTRLAEKIRERWMRLNEKIFKATGRLMEKYDVVNLMSKAGGGEYPSQDGFGWTNGVYRALERPKESLRHLQIELPTKSQ